MEDINYKINRDSIYVGEVVRTDEIIRYEGSTNFFRTKPDELYPGNYFSYRSMLFTPNEDKLSNDLLYSSPNYPILNITDDETCLNLGKNSIVIKDACNLAALLEYFGYNKELTFEDIMKIRKTFFTGRFAMDNCELFGWKEDKPEAWVYDGKITDSDELNRRTFRERKFQQAGYRSFTSVSESVLPREYFKVLDKMGDNNLVRAIECHEKMNAFAPDQQEGPIKKLTKF